MIEIGKKPPAFTLKDQDGRPVRPHDLEGQWHAEQVRKTLSELRA